MLWAYAVHVGCGLGACVEAAHEPKLRCAVSSGRAATSIVTLHPVIHAGYFTTLCLVGSARGFTRLAMLLRCAWRGPATTRQLALAGMLSLSNTRQRVRLAPRIHGTQNMQQVLLTPCNTTARVTCAKISRHAKHAASPHRGRRGRGRCDGWRWRRERATSADGLWTSCAASCERIVLRAQRRCGS